MKASEIRQRIDNLNLIIKMAGLPPYIHVMFRGERGHERYRLYYCRNLNYESYKYIRDLERQVHYYVRNYYEFTD